MPLSFVQLSLRPSWAYICTSHGTSCLQASLRTLPRSRPCNVSLQAATRAQ